MYKTKLLPIKPAPPVTSRFFAIYVNSQILFFGQTARLL
jgi:hypothetical protein